MPDAAHQEVGLENPAWLAVTHPPSSRRSRRAIKVLINVGVNEYGSTLLTLCLCAAPYQIPPEANKAF